MTSPYTPFTPFVGLVTLLILLPDTALAHLVTTGLGPVYDGIGHLVLTPEDLVPTVALALYCGLRGARVSRYAIFILPMTWFLGGLCGTMIGFEPSFPVPVISFLLLGLLIAADIALPLQSVMIITLVIGTMHGFLNGLVLKSGPGVSGLFGITAALFVLLTLLSSFVVTLRKNWTRIVIRVIGSWVAASGMLMIGWYLKAAG